jgi:hypothetical protein
VDERLHNWILAWILDRSVLGDGREVYYYDPDHYLLLDRDQCIRDELMGKGTVKMTKVKMTMADLTLEERETAITQSAADRSRWIIYTDDPVMITKLERLGMPAVVRVDGIGREYIVEANQVSFRRKRIMTEEQKEKRREQARVRFGHGHKKLEPDASPDTAPQSKSNHREREGSKKCEACDGTGWEEDEDGGKGWCSVCGGTGVEEED